MTSEVEGVIKTDEMGRMRTSAARRESLLGEFDKSGLSAKKFAEVTGIKYQTLATWLQKRRKGGQPLARSDGTMKWLEAVVEQAQNASPSPALPIILRWPGGAQLELADIKQIPLAAALIRALAQPC